jgi:hypothetical protein
MNTPEPDAPPLLVLHVPPGPLLPLLIANLATLQQARAELYGQVNAMFLHLARDCVAGRVSTPPDFDAAPPPVAEQSIEALRLQVQPGPLARMTLDHLANLQAQREYALAKVDSVLAERAQQMVEQVTAMHQAAAAGPAH